MARALALGIFVLFSAGLAGCGSIPYAEHPASGHTPGDPLRVAILDETGGDDWTPAINNAVLAYTAAAPSLRFQRDAAGAHIVMTMRRYDDARPPQLEGYRFQPGVGGFAAVYDTDGVACNFPPSSLPVNCSGEIARAEIYLNDIIPAGSDIEHRRLRLILHEMGHGMGLTRHSPDLGIAQLSQRYGW
jgi:hypothetical protein